MGKIRTCIIAWGHQVRSGLSVQPYVQLRLEASIRHRKETQSQNKLGEQIQAWPRLRSLHHSGHDTRKKHSLDSAMLCWHSTFSANRCAVTIAVRMHVAVN